MFSFYFIFIFGERRQLACCSPYTSSTMPHSSKRAAEAFAHHHAGQRVFSTAPQNISESNDGSAYHISNGKTAQILTSPKLMNWWQHPSTTGVVYIVCSHCKKILSMKSCCCNITLRAVVMLSHFSCCFTILLTYKFIRLLQGI